MKFIVGLLVGVLLFGGAEHSHAKSYYYTFEVINVQQNQTWQTETSRKYQSQVYSDYIITNSSIERVPGVKDGHKYIFFIDEDRRGVEYHKPPTGNTLEGDFYAHLLTDTELAAMQPDFLNLLGVWQPFDGSRYGQILSDENCANDFADGSSYLGEEYGWEGKTPYAFLESSKQGWDENYLSGASPFSIGNYFMMADYGERVVTKYKLGYPVNYDPVVTHLQSWVRTTVVLTNITPAPEPATMLLMGTGLAGLLGIRRKNKA